VTLAQDMSTKIRIAHLTDLPAIDNIYNQAILQKTQTADTTPLTLERRKAWFQNHPQESYPIFVLLERNKVIGWSTISKYREGRLSLKSTAEVSYYLDSAHQGKGHGKHLLEFTVRAAKSRGYKNLIALLLASNLRSVGLLKKYNFQEWGRVPDAAMIEGQSYDHLYLGLRMV